MNRYVFRFARFALATALLIPAGLSLAQQVPEAGALAKMPIKEITVFKDGHALVVHEGKMVTDADGNVQMDYLPTPVLGTFWPYVQPGGPKLSAVTASPRRVHVGKTALSIREMLESNVGSQCHITEIGGKKYSAKIVGIPERSSAELERSSPPDSGDRLPEKGELVLLKTEQGTLALPLARIQDLTIAGDYHDRVTTEEFRNLLTLKLDWHGAQVGKSADVGMMYLQKGIRWIPSYKISLDGKGNAAVSLQATLVNEMTDLKDVTANLVIGVPTFYYQDQIDPIALQQTAAQLSQYFAANSPTGSALSNGMMGQMAGFGAGGFGGRAAQPAPAPVDLGPEVTDSGRNEDLFLFTVKHITLKKGQRMTLPVVDFPLKYHDLYTVDIPIAPPRELRSNGSLNEQQIEQIRMQNLPTAEHKIRLLNKSRYPLTTAPALILSGGKVVAQAMMTYTAIGGDNDLKLTTAVNFKVKKSDKETARVPNAANFQGHEYGRIDLAGTISITNFSSESADLEVTRNVLGNVLTAEHDGQVTMVNAVEDDDFAPRSFQNPIWWGWYSWPYWWYHFNGVGRITWKLNIPAGKSMDLGYSWNYYWQ